MINRRCLDSLSMMSFWGTYNDENKHILQFSSLVGIVPRAVCPKLYKILCSSAPTSYVSVYYAMWHNCIAVIIRRLWLHSYIKTASPTKKAAPISSEARSSADICRDYDTFGSCGKYTDVFAKPSAEGKLRSVSTLSRRENGGQNSIILRTSVSVPS